MISLKEIQLENPGGNIKLFLVMISEIAKAEYCQNHEMGRWRERLNRKTGSAGTYLDCARLCEIRP